MERSAKNITPRSRIGFQYYPDALHYRQSDLDAWLPELKDMGTGWLVLSAPADRAVPESFLRGLIDNQIEPILQFNLPVSNGINSQDLQVLLESYGHWGVTYISLFDRPNTQKAWGDGNWVQQQLIERFLDCFIPMAEQVCQYGMRPIFPGLAPGGDFWDTVFLRACLNGIKARGHTRLLNEMVLGAYAWPNQRPLDWGAGGPTAWPEVRPYDTPKGHQDQLGFRIFEWYQAASLEVTGREIPILLLGTGQPPLAEERGDLEQNRLKTNLQIAQMLTSDDEESLPGYVLAGCFSRLSAEPNNPDADQAWFVPGRPTLPEAAGLRRLAAERLPKSSPKSGSTRDSRNKPVAHYLLLPHPKLGNPAWFLKVSQSFIQKHAPTIGYRLEEAFLAEHVTVIGGDQVFPPDLKENLELAGCKVIQVTGSGTEIASILATL